MAASDPATDAQVKAIYAIAAGQGVAPEAIPLYAGRPLAGGLGDLTRGEASALIDKLKEGAEKPPTPAVPLRFDGMRLEARRTALLAAVQLLSPLVSEDADGARQALFGLAARMEQWLFRE